MYSVNGTEYQSNFANHCDEIREEDQPSNILNAVIINTDAHKSLNSISPRVKQMEVLNKWLIALEMWKQTIARFAERITKFKISIQRDNDLYLVVRKTYHQVDCNNLVFGCVNDFYEDINSRIGNKNNAEALKEVETMTIKLRNELLQLPASITEQQSLINHLNAHAVATYKVEWGALYRQLVERGLKEIASIRHSLRENPSALPPLDGMIRTLDEESKVTVPQWEAARVDQLMEADKLLSDLDDKAMAKDIQMDAIKFNLAELSWLTDSLRTNSSMARIIDRFNERRDVLSTKIATATTSCMETRAKIESMVKEQYVLLEANEIKYVVDMCDTIHTRLITIIPTGIEQHCRRPIVAKIDRLAVSFDEPLSGLSHAQRKLILPRNATSGLVKLFSEVKLSLPRVAEERERNDLINKAKEAEQLDIETLLLATAAMCTVV